MFIRIEDDILHATVNLPPDSRAAHTLMEVSLAVIRGKHYVFIPHWHEYSEQLEKVLSINTFRVLNGLRQQDGNALDSHIERKLIVTDNVPEDIPDNVLIFSPSNNSLFEIFEETHLICENINEKHFYDKVEAFYRRFSAPEYSHNTRYNVLPRNGGGASCASVFITEKHMGHHLIFTVADSDYKYSLTSYENGEETTDKGEIGSTASNLKKIKEEDPYDFGDIYIMEDCREVENLIPKKILKETHPNNNQLSIDLIDNHDMEYLDVKEGIQITHMFDDKVLRYWTNYLTTISYDFVKISDVKRVHRSKNKYKEYLKGCSDEDRRNNIIIEGWGNGILEDTLVKKGSVYDTLNPMDLTPSQIREWNNIGKNLFEWGLASFPLLR